MPRVPDTHRCKRLHGHSYSVALELVGPVDPASGFVVDFFDIEAAFAPVLAELDHHLLNEVPGLENPTAENIAMWIWRRIKDPLPQLAAVTLYETQACWARYEGD